MNSELKAASRPVSASPGRSSTVTSRPPVLPGIGAKIIKAFVSLSSVQGVGAVIGVVGNVLLVRLLSPEVFGLYAVVTFFVGAATLCSDFGMHHYLIRWPGEIGRDVTDTAFTLRVGLIGALALLVLVIVAPLASTWYGTADLYWLLVIAVAGVGAAGVFRISHSLLEREMEYPKLALIELVGVLAFYGMAVLMAYLGFGVYSLVAGEVCRALTASLGYVARPFRPALRVNREVAKAILRFGLSYQAMMFTWMLGSGVNPIVVAKVVGFKAAGIIRIAEAITGQLTVLKGIADRVSYPALSRYQGDRDSLVAAVQVGRLWQCVVGVMPLFAFTALGFWLVPVVYGSDWRDVANVLPLLCLAVAANSFFALQSPALITIGRNWDVAKFHATYVLSIWGIAPVCVWYLGYLGLPVAMLLVTPTYMVIQQAFTKHLGPLNHRRLAVPLLTSWVITVVAWDAGNVAASAAIFGVGHVTVAALSPSLRRRAARLVNLARAAIQERWQVAGACREGR